MDGNNITPVVKEQSPEVTATSTPDTTQPRWKSWTMWLSVIGALWVICSAFGIPTRLGVTSETFNTIVSSIGTILIAFGIVNNPTDSSKL